MITSFALLTISRDHKNQPQASAYVYMSCKVDNLDERDILHFNNKLLWL